MTLAAQTPDLPRALALIDAANAADPNLEAGEPAALLYGQRMTEELDRLFPDADPILRIAARGQHVERWLLPRSSYPMGKPGYLEWRREQGRRHAERVAGIMAEAGFPEADQQRAGTLLRKEGIKRDALVQALEDVICFTFLRWYFEPFAATRPAEDIPGIVEKTARKMSPEARARVLAEFPLPEALAAAFRDENPR
ncbi:DUF4202 domain-containing protein [Xinfangfangia sp. CPCC 101601]|uniref:DUF4202 domain-containing protein n=1 Tax=Pseudogemmobacter lacusdianii TaxID=3069608 RepID=A0ABU0VZS4_9RHOB|nr:DUF4202 domain-containing protein [Xinfangfangia sp. CPCC 101601]MDQ2066390.1 DUF4202 domain-containing protein [Xinfangfangia sp. CPCC 101601]